MRQHGPWQVRSTKDIHQDDWVQLSVDAVTRPDGKPGTYTVVRVVPGVCVLAVDDDGVAHLAEEFRYAVGRPSLEGVGGAIEPEEDPLDAARRELREEVGIEADRWTALGTVDPLTSLLEAPVRLYLAEGLTFHKSHPEGTERIRRVPLPLTEAVAAVEDGRITHAPTCVLVLKAARHLARMERLPRRARVLVIEDNRDAAESLSLLLQDLGCEVAVALDGPAGVEAARAAPPDIVFCDIGLPGLDGYGVARHLRAEAWGPRVTLVAVTGFGREEDRRQAEEAGFDLHFVKPADPAAITRLFKDVGLPSTG